MIKTPGLQIVKIFQSYGPMVTFTFKIEFAEPLNRFLQN